MGWLFIYVRVKHVKISAVKNKYYIKKHCSCRCRVYCNRCLMCLCIYFLYLSCVLQETWTWNVGFLDPVFYWPCLTWGEGSLYISLTSIRKFAHIFAPPCNVQSQASLRTTRITQQARVVLNLEAENVKVFGSSPWRNTQYPDLKSM